MMYAVNTQYANMDIAFPLDLDDTKDRKGDGGVSVPLINFGNYVIIIRYGGWTSAIA